MLLCNVQPPPCQFMDQGEQESHYIIVVRKSVLWKYNEQNERM
jgi:hypothetical protein